MNTLKRKKATLLIAVLGALSILFYNCHSGGNTATENQNDSSSIFNFTASFQIPEDVAVNASDTALAAYAWQEFLALNWKSVNVDSMKGTPDQSWTYDSTSVADTLVWESYAHRTELSPYTYPMRAFDSPSNYSYQYMPQPGSGSPSFTLLHNLDETSEIGSCNLFAFIDSTNLYPDTNVVRYQAKTNRVEYDYIRNNFPTQDSLSNTVQRTQAFYNAKFQNPADTSGATGLLNLPNGSIEVKTAWRQLKPGEDASQFFTRNVITYSSQPTGNTFTYTNKTYALIGMHIIHKSPNHPSFVFATWEHMDVQIDSMKYVLLAGGAETGGFKTPIRNPIPNIMDLATAYVHHHLLPSISVWRHYRLVGVQGTPTSNTATPSFFLANYVIESDSLLARFHGSGFANPFDGRPNVVYNNDTFSVGGCQGCHGGGAQHGGADFSFIVNSPNSTPDGVAGPPTTSTAATANLPGAKLWMNKLARLKAKYK